jgi:hypothetical protein
MKERSTGRALHPAEDDEEVMMSNIEATTATKGTQEVWHVQLATGELRVMTLDQLDDAFQNGLVSENTFVYQSGMNDWVKLSELAGLSGDGDETPSTGVRGAESASGDSSGEIAVELSSEPTIAPPPIAAPSPFAAPSPAGQQAPHPLHNSNASPFGVIAVPNGLAANSLFAPTIGPNSTAPVAADKPDLEFDTDVPFANRKSSRAKWVLAVAALGAVGVAGVGMMQGWFAKPSSAAALELPPLPTEAPVAMQTPPAAEPAPADKAPSADPSQGGRINDNTKKALLDADKARAEKNRARQRVNHAAASAPRGRPAKSATPFHKGGNPHDPLNSSL